MYVRFDWDGEKVEKRLEEALFQGLWHAALHLLHEAQAVVPIEEGTLERSGVASKDRGALQCAVSFDTVYAVRQHEELTWRHDPGRQAKYLEAPMHIQRDIMLAIIAAALRRAMR
ncbi:hypothetical protein AB0B28_08145 [Glycomyces sp. NPDC046736]|uniref:hypothetical protein n=1 Tax=Glycomyces sp. NPDC046736 TaxID=3155615 RepID=UPI0033CFCFA0